MAVAHTCSLHPIAHLDQHLKQYVEKMIKNSPEAQ